MEQENPEDKKPGPKEDEYLDLTEQAEPEYEFRPATLNDLFPSGQFKDFNLGF